MPGSSTNHTPTTVADKIIPQSADAAAANCPVFLAAALLMMTSFTRIIIVLSLLRQAIGTQSAPANQVMVGLALFLTLFVMGPVFDKIYVDAYQPLSENKITMMAGAGQGICGRESLHAETNTSG